MDHVRVDRARSLNIAVVKYNPIFFMKERKMKNTFCNIITTLAQSVYNPVFYKGKIKMKNIFCNMTKTTLQSIALVCALTFGTTAIAEDKATDTKEDTITLDGDEKLVTVNGKDITVLDWNVEFQALPQQTQQQGQDALYAPLLDTLINKTVIADKAIEEGLADTKEFRAFLKKAERDMLSQMYVDMKLDEILAEVDLQQEYDELKSEWQGKQEIETSHILVKSRKDAEEIIVALNNGADFKALAKAKSTGPSGPAGGTIGWVAPGQTVQPFEDALFALGDGDISQKPIKTQFGWHVILRENSREKQIPDFETMELQIREAIIDEELAKLIESVMETAKVYKYDIKTTKSKNRIIKDATKQ